jgi:hypothetical protein
MTVGTLQTLNFLAPFTGSAGVRLVEVGYGRGERRADDVEWAIFGDEQRLCELGKICRLGYRLVATKK